VGVLLKHKNITALMSPDTDVGYAPRPEDLVIALGMDKLFNALAQALWDKER
jgi:hypothetical protein